MRKEEIFKFNIQLFAEPVVTPPEPTVEEPVVNTELQTALGEIEKLKAIMEEKANLEKALAEKDEVLKAKELAELKLKEELENEKKYKEELTKIANSNDDVAKKREELERQLEKEKAEKARLNEAKRADDATARLKELEKQLELEKLNNKKIEESNNFERLKLNLIAEKSDNRVLVDAIKEANSPEILEFVLKTLDKVEIKDQSVMAQMAGQNAFSNIGTPVSNTTPKSLDDVLDDILRAKGKKK